MLLNGSLGGVSFKVDPDTGKITGYTTKIGGADSVFPFSGEVLVQTLKSGKINSSGLVTFNETYTIEHDGYIHYDIFNNQSYGSRPITITKNGLTVESGYGQNGLLAGTIQVVIGDEINVKFDYGIAELNICLLYAGNRTPSKLFGNNQDVVAERASYNGGGKSFVPVSDYTFTATKPCNVLVTVAASVGGGSSAITPGEGVVPVFTHDYTVRSIYLNTHMYYMEPGQTVGVVANATGDAYAIQGYGITVLT